MSTTHSSDFRILRLLSYLALATRSKGDVDEATSVEDALVGAALGDLGLLLLLDLGGLRLDLTCNTESQLATPANPNRTAWDQGMENIPARARDP